MDTQEIDRITKEGIDNAVDYVETGFSDELEYQFYFGQINAYNHIRAANGLSVIDATTRIDQYWNEKKENNN